MKRTRMMVGALIAVVALSATAMAQPGEGRCGGKGGPRGEGPLAALNLTDAQKEQVKALHEQFEQDNSALLEQMKSLHDQAHDQMKSGDKEAAQQTREEMRGLGEQLREAREGLEQQVEALLTAEQKAKLEELKAQRGERGSRGGGKGMRGEAPKGVPPSIQ
ncbi:MAG: Spy/CpxP family protein refolding chaperone [Ignavibacteriae bacterium]|nr:Spy/CpxP family protein refolding chaperone [Ignavibacteriota bacterium]MCB9215045.1 Spy/CpxP family protein refolding chaperone [Ignavibacteria bacterium]